MKNLFILLLTTILTVTLTAQDFDIDDFNEKFEIAEYLYEYDLIAWWTSDSVMNSDQGEIEQLGAEWFCVKGDRYWRAYYGKDVSGNFNSVFQYHVDSSYMVARTYEETDSTLLNPYSRALVNSSRQTKVIRNSSKLRFNQYVRKTANSEIEVWVLPAFQPNSTAVFGGEYYYLFDATGNNLLTKNEYFQGELRGFKVGEPREIWLDYTDVESPTLGAVFFVWYYKSYFTQINIETSKSVSTVFKDGEKYTWMHIIKEEEKKTKGRKKKKNRN